MLLGLAVLIVACKREDVSDILDHHRGADTKTWGLGQNAYRTNHLATAYITLLKLRSDMEQMQAKGRRNLDYVYCKAVLNGQLFAMAERLGKTNEADQFYGESARYWMENSIELRLAAKHYTKDEVRRLIAAYDTHTGPVLWRQEENAMPDTNSAK